MKDEQLDVEAIEERFKGGQPNDKGYVNEGRVKAYVLGPQTDVPAMIAEIRKQRETIDELNSAISDWEDIASGGKMIDEKRRQNRDCPCGASQLMMCESAGYYAVICYYCGFKCPEATTPSEATTKMHKHINKHAPQPEEYYV